MLFPATKIRNFPDLISTWICLLGLSTLHSNESRNDEAPIRGFGDIWFKKWQIPERPHFFLYAWWISIYAKCTCQLNASSPFLRGPDKTICILLVVSLLILTTPKITHFTDELNTAQLGYSLTGVIFKATQEHVHHQVLLFYFKREFIIQMPIFSLATDNIQGSQQVRPSFSSYHSQGSINS